MAIPTVVAVGTAATPAITAVTPAFPAGIATDDILIGISESAGAETYPSAATNGFAHVAGLSPVTQDSQTTLTVIWARYDGVMTAHSWGDSGNHNQGRYIAIRGCHTAGNPWDVVTTVVESTSDTSASWPSVTTTVVDTLVLLAIATGSDIATAQVGAVTNAALGTITERMDNWTTTGTGGGYGLVTGTKATIGVVGASTATITTAATKAFMTLALKEPQAAPPPPPILVMAPPNSS